MSFKECSTSSSMAKMGAVTCTHKRSKSFPDKSELEEDKVNHCLESSDRVKLPATEIIKEIAVLEYEVSHLEQYLLSLYRTTFDQQISCPSSSRNDEIFKPPLITPRGKYLESCRLDISLKPETPVNPSIDHLQVNSCKDSNGGIEEKDGLLHSGVQHCHFSTHSPSNIISLAEHLGTRISDHVPETPNKISEDMIKCMSAIYCKLAEPPLTNHGLSSPTSSLSSISGFSPKDHSDMMWGPGFRRDSSSFDVRLENPFDVQGLKEFSGPYSTMVEVQFLYRDNLKLGDMEHMFQHFRSLVSRLEDVDPRKLKHEEKLAFWINVHNALVMHAVLANGIPQNNMKRVFLLLRAAYNVSGHIISADVIQNSILGCRMSRPGQWLRVLLSSRTKFKVGEERQTFAIDHPEPHLHFALCSGCHSDPAVRVYTPKRVLQELEVAKEEFVRATFGIGKDHKILLPKIVESFAKDSGLCVAAVIEMIQHCLHESVRKSIKKRQVAISRKNIIWAPHNFGFRYLISKELLK